jgi:catechol 2,3-dioxygenase-like lactoylglutathione lyase family enzyme
MRNPLSTVAGIDHIQIAAPKGCKAEARRFFGQLLGLEEIEKPEPLRRQGSESLRSSLWVMRDGRWQMLFHQGTTIPGAKY